MRPSTPYFEGDQSPPRFFVYRDTEQIAVLEYDPVAAVERLDETVKTQEAEIIRLSNLVSEKEAAVIDAIRGEKDAHDRALNAQASENFLATLNAELRVRVKELARKIRNYGQ